MTTKKLITLLIMLAIILVLAISEIIYHIKEAQQPVEDIPTGASITEQNPDELDTDLSIEEENEDVSIDK